ncbi:RnfH family protein [uncultured Oxalicibacterium sp.]|uniref:RnfH family protein n=1 Tax=uncultured Oxalicibacterium sp. TaxID=1168540 RepID=UPI0025D90000|nr:RnfH family protein [uncultured Oxalicibacterium sp.]
MANPSERVAIQICYATPLQQFLIDHVVDAGTTIQQAIDSSGIVRNVPEIDISVCKVGIYGKIKTLDTIVRAQDRIEIYRPLIADPKESRRRRADKSARNEKKPV